MGRLWTQRWKPYLFSIETFPYNFKKLLFSFSFFSSYGFQESTLISTPKPKLSRKQLLATAREMTGGGLSDYTESDCSNKTSRSSLRSCGSRTLCKRNAWQSNLSLSPFLLENIIPVCSSHCIFLVGNILNIKISRERFVFILT